MNHNLEENCKLSCHKSIRVLEAGAPTTELPVRQLRRLVASQVIIARGSYIVNKERRRLTSN